MRTSELKGGGDVTISPLRMPVAAERPAFSFLHFVAAARPSELTLFHFSLATLKDAMRSLDVSRIVRDR